MIRHHNLALDGIRGLAIIGVLLTHSLSLYPESGIAAALRYPFTFGWSGVDLFFVLSGFLITRILLDTRGAVNRARAFYMRRFLRIFPLYYAAILIAFTVAVWKPHLESLRILQSWGHRLCFLVFLQNYLALLPGDPTQNSAVGHFWSLAVEEQFYLVWPWFVWRLSARTLLRVTFVGILCSFLLRCVVVHKFGPHFWINALTFTRGEGLLMGSFIATLIHIGRPPSRRLLAIMGTCGGLILAFIAFCDPQEYLNTDAGPYMYTVGLSGIGLLFGALVGSSIYTIPVFTRFVTLRILRILGKYSYGIYVYHVPVYFAVHAVLQRAGLRFPLPLPYSIVVTGVSVAACFLVARSSYRLYEARFLKLKKHFEPEYASLAAERTSTSYIARS